MKKLFVAILTAGLTIVANATTINWEITDINSPKFSDGSVAYLLQGTFTVPEKMPVIFAIDKIGKFYGSSEIEDGVAGAESKVTTESGFSGQTPFYMLIINGGGTSLAYLTTSQSIPISDGTLSKGFSREFKDFTILDAQIVPEPLTTALFMLGLSLLMGLRRKTI